MFILWRFSFWLVFIPLFTAEQADAELEKVSNDVLEESERMIVMIDCLVEVEEGEEVASC